MCGSKFQERLLWSVNFKKEKNSKNFVKIPVCPMKVFDALRDWNFFQE